MKVWEYKYNGHKIRVENHWDRERLMINGELQDEQIGLASRSRLWGKLESGETVKVSLGGVFLMHCNIFVENKLVLGK